MRFAATLLVQMLALGTLAGNMEAARSKPIVLGTTATEAAKHEPEFRRFGRMRPLYQYL